MSWIRHHKSVAHDRGPFGHFLIGKYSSVQPVIGAEYMRCENVVFIKFTSLSCNV